MTAADSRCFNQLMPGVGAKGGDVDDRQRVGGLQPQTAARLHRRQAFLCFENGQGAVQPLEIVDGSAFGQALNRRT